MQRLVWGHKGNLNSIDGLSCHRAGCIEAESFSLHRPGQQQTEAEGAEDSRVTGQDGWGGAFREDVSVWMAAPAPGALWGAKLGRREIPFSVIFLFLSCSHHSSAEKRAGPLASVGK